MPSDYSKEATNLLTNLHVSETMLAALPGEAGSVTALVIQFSKIPGEPARPAQLEHFRRIIRQVSSAFGGVTADLGENRMLTLFPAQPIRLALRAALTLRARLDKLSREEESEKRPTYRIGIGLHTGLAQPADCLEAGVAEAANLSTLNQQAPFPALFVSEQMVRALPEANGYHVHDLGVVDLPEQPRPIAVFALMR
jgi:class 3 adenylate cyclase